MSGRGKGKGPYMTARRRNLGVTQKAAASSLDTGIIPKGVAGPGSKRAEMLASIAAATDTKIEGTFRGVPRSMYRIKDYRPNPAGYVSAVTGRPPGAPAPAPAPAPAAAPPGAGAGSGAAAAAPPPPPPPPEGGRRRRRNTKKISRRRRRQHKTRHRRF